MCSFKCAGSVGAMVSLVIAFTAGSAAAASLPSMLNVTFKPVTGRGFGVIELQALSGTTIKCQESSMEGGLLTEDTGTFHIRYAKCTSEGIIKATCTGKDGILTDASGTILWLGSFKIVHDVTEPGSTYAILFESSPAVEFECTSLVKVKVTGSVLCLVTEPTTEREVHDYACKSRTIGDPQETSYWSEMRLATAALSVSFNGGTAESSAVVASAAFETTGSPKAVIMN
jgi:hypothetical protein